MTSKRMWFFLLVTAWVLVGCLGEPYKGAYTARGESERARDLEKTASFNPTEDLQLVLKFNQHSKSLRLELDWKGPDGKSAGKLQTDVPSDAENMIVTFDLARAALEYWTPGDWSVTVRVDGKLVDTVKFAVVGEIPEAENQRLFG